MTDFPEFKQFTLYKDSGDLLTTKAHSVQVVEMTHEEQMKMYMKSSKEELCKMLIQCNLLLSSFQPRVSWNPLGYEKGVTTIATFSDPEGLPESWCVRNNDGSGEFQVVRDYLQKRQKKEIRGCFPFEAPWAGVRLDGAIDEWGDHPPFEFPQVLTIEEFNKLMKKS